ncbi:MAG: response regulator [Chloroflexi bacterium]|nr:response regulator [Chloroflexota bacterium]
MNEGIGLAPYVVDLVIERTRDHAPALAEFAARIEPFAGELLSVWANTYRQIALTYSPGRETGSGELTEEVVRAFFTGLRYSNLREAFTALDDWARQLAQSSLLFDGALRLSAEYQRTLVPLLMRAYSPGPELQLTFEALDELFNGITLLVSTAYIETGQTRLAAGAQYRVIGQLTGGAAHSLNDVLASILGRAQLLHDRVRDDDARYELDEISHAATSGAQMMRRLQEFARAETQSQFVETDVNLLLRDASEVTRFMWRDQAEVQGLFIDVVRDFADVPPVRAQPMQLRRVFVELIINAIEALPRGGMITLRTERKANTVLVSIIDNGEGMADAVRQRIFDPFFSTKGSPHLGMGLTMAARTLTDHNGIWSIESAPGRGTTVTLTLIVAPRVTEPKAVAPEETPQVLSVLVIDNESAVRDMVGRMLSSEGHSVVTAESGSEGIAEYRRKKFDLVFTDLGMPGMSGWEVAQGIKRLNPQAIVVLMSGWAVSLDPRKAHELGVDLILQKPFDVAEVLRVIAESRAVSRAM